MTINNKKSKKKTTKGFASVCLLQATALEKDAMRVSAVCISNQWENLCIFFILDHFAAPVKNMFLR